MSFPACKDDAVHEARHASGDDTALPNFFDSLEVLSTPAVRKILLIAGDIVGKGRYFRNEKMSLIPAPPSMVTCAAIRGDSTPCGTRVFLVKEIFMARPRSDNPTLSSADPESGAASPLCTYVANMHSN